ncbi:hypothetical protein BXY85_2753 [Roseivirga pacifica]|uniref:Uncharacterized protein n=1 Tax=Roseivirga pacifica TaxID=1267423 RepID=A0A1I0P674_9BACT|nr:hypothetical protein [Roseivirga pacifica]RKQ51721.1 hypothetical protein BXY85_2753 [Roseivirga pacifica]SEW09534.1 hypothetical protein SAMN05216290_1734 [Roseivirga pacifica]
MKKAVILSLVLVLTFAFTGCKNDDDPSEEVKFSLIVNNNTQQSIDVYLKDDVTATSTFINQGTVVAGGSKTVANLVISVNYTVRAVAVGGDPEAGPFLLNQTFSSSNNSNITYNVD